MNEAEELESSSAFLQPRCRNRRPSSVVTEYRCRQLQNLTTDALELNRAIVRLGIFRDACYGVDDSVAGPVSSEGELLEHAVLLRFGQAEPPGDYFHDLADR